MAFIAIVVVGAGLYVLKNYVGRDLAFAEAPPQVVLKNRPTWMKDQHPRHDAVLAKLIDAAFATGNTDYIVPFANSDALRMNQTAAGYLLNGVKNSATGTYSTAPC